MSSSGDLYVGLMSGTSLDGISAALVRFESAGERVTHELLAHHNTPYTDLQRARLSAAMSGASAESYSALAFELGDLLASAALNLIEAAGVDLQDVRAIASHGQTLWHSPRSSTWQIGESAVIAERTGLDVVSDFRVRDVAAGGEGAPLVPVADALLYADEHAWRLLQNVGGIGNLAVIPPGGSTSGVRAFDTGPGVVLVDQLVRELFDGARYDEGGAIALAGTPHYGVIAELMRDPYFAVAPPKSTGREYFDSAFAHRIISMLGESCERADIIATAVAFTAESIADAVRRFVVEPCTEMVISGGGTRNAALVEALRQSLAPLRVTLFDELFYDAEAKEAVAFALLGYLHIARRPGNVIGATGARGPRVLGKLTPA
jgi:anhydro-N-acetylmuramic acid kinase